MNLTTLNPTKNEFYHLVMLSPMGGGMGTGVGFWMQNFVPSSATVSARSGRPGLRTSNVKS